MPAEDADLLKIRQDSSILWRALDDEIIALDLKNSVYVRMNPTGAFIWQKLGEPSSRDQLVTALVDRYGIPTERAQEDVDAFLSQLETKGFLEG